MTRRPGLDVVRCAAILLVVIGHGRNIVPGSGLYADGFLGVELFFCLSGCLIGRILLDEFGAERPYALLRFLGRRWLRTLPCYVLILTVNVLFYSGSNEGYWRYYLFLQNLASPMESRMMQESWSLSVEEWFYVLFPLYLLVVMRTGKEYRQCFLAATISFLTLPLLLRLVVGTQEIGLGSTQLWDAQFRKVVVFRLDAIGYGVLLSFLLEFHEQRVYKYRHIALLAGTGLLALTLFYFTSGIAGFQNTAFFSLVGVALTLILSWCYYIKSLPAPLLHLVTNISKTSYSIYLLHGLVLTTALNMDNFEPITQYSIYILGTFILANVLYRGLELPFMNLRERIALLRS